MASTGVLRPGHAAIRVMDMEQAEEHYIESIGLIKTNEDAEGRVYLKGWDELDSFSIVLRQAEEAGIDFMGFKVRTETDLEHFENKLKDYGRSVERIPAGEMPSCGERVRFDSPSGHIFELYSEKEQIGNGLGRINPDPWPKGLKGMKPRRFDHALLMGSDASATAQMFIDVLGFDLTEQAVDPDGNRLASFLSCSNKAHDIALVEYPEPAKLHHISFRLDTWEEVLHAADLISMDDISLDVSPTRHAITQGTIVYFFDPSGNRNEVFCGDYTWYPDHGPITWTADQLGRAIFYHERKMKENFLEVVT